jgi:hypothetical protein
VTIAGEEKMSNSSGLDISDLALLALSRAIMEESVRRRKDVFLFGRMAILAKKQLEVDSYLASDEIIRPSAPNHISNSSVRL